MWDRATVLLMERWRGARSGEEPSRAMHRDWLSVKMATDVDWSRCWLIQCTAICMALLSSSKEQVNAAPRSIIGAYDIRGCRVAGDDDDICTTISGACAGRPVSVDFILSVQLTGSADLMVEMESRRLAMAGREGWTGQCSGTGLCPTDARQSM